MPGAGFVGAVAVSRIFLSHSSKNNAEAIALCDWLKSEGWDDVFLDLDSERGIKSGERWEEALRDAADQCEAVLFLISSDWLASEWCRDEFRLVRHLRKRLFGILIDNTPPGSLPALMTREWQLVSIAAIADSEAFSVTPPGTTKAVEVKFEGEGLRRLKIGLQAARLDAKYFAWPPSNDPNRPPYRGLRPLEAEDAGIFFGRDAPVVEALDRLRGLREAATPKLLFILGASGAGKSSFLRAGLLPRLARDDQNFLALPAIRPERAAISGDTGLLHSLEGAFAAARSAMTRADLRAAIQGGAAKLLPLLKMLADKAKPIASGSDADPKPPALVLPIDQAEELFLAEGRDEASSFLALLRDLVDDDAAAIIAVFTVRSDNYERFQLSQELGGVRHEVLSISPLPKGSYVEVIKGPARRLDGTARAFKIEESLVDELLADIEADGAKDALPLLAFTLERLYEEYRAGGHLKLSHYNELGRVKGSIEAAVARALKAADLDPAIPRDHTLRQALLRSGLIPWLASIDADTGAPRRRIARLAEIPIEARPLIQNLVEQRLLSTDFAKDTRETTVEPVHEALLRQWSLLHGWLTEDAGLLAVLEGVKRASRDWTANGMSPAWLSHAGGRLEAAARLIERPDLAAGLQAPDRDYIARCRNTEDAAKTRARRLQASIYILLAGVIIGLIIWINQAYVEENINWLTTMRPYMVAQVRPYVLSAAAERALKPLESFRECAKDCPTMIVVPAGEYTMGSPPTESGRDANEGPQHQVAITASFAVSQFDVTFADLDACIAVGGCAATPDGGFGRGAKPAINVAWDGAERYVAWLSRMTGRNYRLLTEAEWEYAARANSTTAYYWGDELGKGNANCSHCGSAWDNRETSPVGSFKPNAFGLYDMAGNVWQWVQDCYHDDYRGAPADGSAWASLDCDRHVVRGGSWTFNPTGLRSANRSYDASDNRYASLGFRIGRSLGH
jgi:formylglycine-generating enzyme required for sulfatase activity